MVPVNGVIVITRVVVRPVLQRSMLLHSMVVPCPAWATGENDGAPGSLLNIEKAILETGGHVTAGY